MKNKLIRTATISGSLNTLLKGQLKFLNNHFEVIALSGYNEKLEEVKNREEVRIIDVSMERRISPFRDLVSLIQLVKVFKKERPLMVHSITPKAGLLSMVAGKIAGVPIRMHTFTGLIFPSRTGLMQKLLIKMDQLLCWAATNVYPEGEGVKNDLLKYNITSKSLEVLANGNINGIDLNYFNPSKLDSFFLSSLKTSLGISETDFVYVFVGRLVRDKGINELVEAFIRLQSSKSCGFKLLLVGSFEKELDPLKKEVMELIESNQDIISVGYQKDVRPYFTISNALVFPSYREGFPNVVMQAGAMNLPSIVSNINGCNEIIEDGVNGSIIPIKNVEALEKEMYKFYEDKEYYVSLKNNCRRIVVERYEQSVVWTALLEEYNVLIDKCNFQKEDKCIN